MRQLLLISIGLLMTLTSCKGQTQSKKKEIHNVDFNWTITIPENFDTVSAEQWAKMQNKGAEAIEKTYDEKVENNARTIFVFRNDQFNYFESNSRFFLNSLENSTYP